MPSSPESPPLPPASPLPGAPEPLAPRPPSSNPPPWPFSPVPGSPLAPLQINPQAPAVGSSALTAEGSARANHAFNAPSTCSPHGLLMQSCARRCSPVSNGLAVDAAAPTSVDSPPRLLDSAVAAAPARLDASTLDAAANAESRFPSQPVTSTAS